MTKTLQTTLAALAALSTLASAASAAEVTVSLTGKDMRTIQADIGRAAREVCNKELPGRTEWLAGYARCVDEAVTRAMAVVPSKAS